MGQTTIEWTATVHPDGRVTPGYTMNPWIGCTKVAAGCTSCYAEAFAKRTGKAKWGPSGTRVKTSESYWKQPLKWNREAQSAGERRRVFCASMADVFEDWRGQVLDHHGRQLFTINGAELFTEGEYPECRPATLTDVLRDLFELIDATPHLDWLLLTKRPENIRRMWSNFVVCRKCGVDSAHRLMKYCGDGSDKDNEHRWEPSARPNAWLGTSIATQADADRNIPLLLQCRDLSPVLFVSAEPLVEAVQWRDEWHGIDWLIVGGESGHHARPMNPNWVYDLRDACRKHDMAFFLKQWGEWAPYGQARIASGWTRTKIDGERIYGKLHHSDYVDGYSETPLFGGREFETRFTEPGMVCTVKIGKTAAGRLLDDCVYDEFPQVERTVTA